jgi:hypothetical protein
MKTNKLSTSQTFAVGELVSVEGLTYRVRGRSWNGHLGQIVSVSQVSATAVVRFRDGEEVGFSAQNLREVF